MIPDLGDGIAPISIVNGAIAWRNWDCGGCFELEFRLRVTNSIFIDNGVGVMPIIYKPGSAGHASDNKFVEVIDSHFVGKSSTFNCDDKISKNDPVFGSR